MRCTRSEGPHTNKTSNGGQQEEDFGEMSVTPQTVVCAMDGFRRSRTSLFSLLDGCLPFSTARAWFFGLPCVNSPARRRKPDGTFLGFTSIPFEPSEIGDPGKKGLSSSFAAEVSFFPRNCRPSKSFKPFCALFVEPFLYQWDPIHCCCLDIDTALSFLTFLQSISLSLLSESLLEPLLFVFVLLVYDNDSH